MKNTTIADIVAAALVLLFFVLLIKKLLTRPSLPPSASYLLKEDEYVRGAKVRESSSLSFSKGAYLCLGDQRVPLPSSLVHRGTLIVGAPRSGKSVVMKQLVVDVQKKGAGGICFDQADLYSCCAEDNAILWDLLDRRSVRPNIFKDVSNRPQDLKLASSIHFPRDEGKEPFFNLACQALFEAFFRFIHRNYYQPDNTTLTTFLRDYPDLDSFVQKLASDSEIQPEIAAYFSPLLKNQEGDKMHHSIFATFVNKMRTYREAFFNHPGDFSLWQHVKDVAEGRSQKMLFIRYRSEDAALVLPYYQTVIAVALERSISLPKIYNPETELPTFFLCDEFPAWTKHSKTFGTKIVHAIAEAQKRGIAVFLTAQSVGQLKQALANMV